jgi:hypothetical protein
VPAPAQALLEQDLVNPAAPHGDPLALKQVGGKPIERPRREGQAQTLWAGQRCSDHRRNRISRVGGWAPRALVVLQSGQPFGVEAANAATHRFSTQAECLGHAGRRLPLAGTPDDAGALDPARRCRPRAGQPLHRCSLFSGQLAQANKRGTHGRSPAEEKPPSYPITCRMNH